MEKDALLFRAQIGKDTEIVKDKNGNYINESSHAFQKERMVPLANLVGEGRANAKGLAYLYLAKREETAMNEVRPWVGAGISLASFRITRNLTLIN